MSGRSAQKAALQAKMRATPDFGPLPVVDGRHLDTLKRKENVVVGGNAASHERRSVRSVRSGKKAAVAISKAQGSSDSESELDPSGQDSYDDNTYPDEWSHRALARTLKPKKGKSRSRKGKGASNPNAKGAVLLNSNDPEIRRYFRTAVAAQDYLQLEKKTIWFVNRPLHPVHIRPPRRKPRR